MFTRKFWKGFLVVSSEMLVVMLVYTTVLGLLVYSVKPFVRHFISFDFTVFHWVSGLVSPAMNRVMVTITMFGQHVFLIPANIFLIVYFLTVRRKTWFSIRVAVIGISSLALMFALKLLFMRQRPDEPLLFEAAGFSFPSGHAVMSTTFYGLLIYISSHTIPNKVLHNILIVLLVLLILLIGFSRIYLRVHYASDVIVGFVAGTSWLLISLYTLKRIENYNKQADIIK